MQELMAYADKHFIDDEELLMLHGKLDTRHVSIHRMEHKSFMYDAQSMWGHLCTEETWRVFQKNWWALLLLG